MTVEQQFLVCVTSLLTVGNLRFTILAQHFLITSIRGADGCLRGAFLKAKKYGIWGVYSSYYVQVLKSVFFLRLKKSLL